MCSFKVRFSLSAHILITLLQFNDMCNLETFVQTFIHIYKYTITLYHIHIYIISSGNIGTITIPLAVAGPVPINAAHAQGEFLLPVATTESAMVASINRGANALLDSSGT